MHPDRRNKLAALSVALLAYQNTNKCILDELETKDDSFTFDSRAKPVITFKNTEMSYKLLDNGVSIDVNNVSRKLTDYTLNRYGYWENLTQEGGNLDEQTIHRLDKVLVGCSMAFCRMLVQDPVLRDVLIKKRSPTDKYGVDLG